MFPWANGDSLRDYWDATPKQKPTRKLVLQALQQLRGLADALDSLHNCNDSQSGEEDANSDDEEHSQVPTMQIRDENDQVTVHFGTGNTKSIRHGDLKPENILRFVDGQDDMGVLKIADLGLAKQHITNTRDRTHLTSTRYGTIRYEAPEAVTIIRGGRSRLYDVWSMGCITLEFIIWMLYGNNELNNFYNQVKGDAKQVCQYFEIPETGDMRRPGLHRVVLQWINHIQNKDPECSQETAIHDLLKVVREKLLVVPLPPNRESSTTGGRVFAPPALGETFTRYRATADEFRDALDDILSKTRRPDYLLTAHGREGLSLPLPKSSILGLSAEAVLPTRNAVPMGALLSGVLGQPIRADYGVPPMRDWEFPVDNQFAETLCARIGALSLSPYSPHPATLCKRCSNLSFWDGGFTFEDKLSALRQRSVVCNLCRFLTDVSPEREDHSDKLITFERKLSHIVITGNPFPVLSIIRSHGKHKESIIMMLVVTSLELKTPTQIQLGFPELLKPGTDEFFAMLRLWLEDCDNPDPRNAKHKECHIHSPGSLPTRLIDVGTTQDPILQLIETHRAPSSHQEYIALSHPWGNTKDYPPFSTTCENLSTFHDCIRYEDLPATFRDAVICTRRLGIRFLWIDSLCIIQGKDGDFNDESKRMESVYSGAYCVLAATCAIDQRSGFLGLRPKRDYITMQHGADRPFYICKVIDNFSKDFIEGSLNKRGWVLQERALARRTIYFTETQTYFECGDGIRCETLTKMHK